jgi:nickel-dependent lactate racemase
VARKPDVANIQKGGAMRVPYGQGHLRLGVPEDQVTKIGLGSASLRSDAIHSLKDDPRLTKYSGKDTLCIVNDATRPTRTQEIISQCSLECDFIVATGAHAAPTPEELAQIFGSGFASRRIFTHDSRRAPCVQVGTTSRGTPVALNRRILSYRRLLIIGSVEPHYFAGYTGGRKGLVPGIAAHETIERNHALYFEPGVEILKLQGNPVHEDMMEATRMLDMPVLTINMVMDASNDIIDVFCGDLRECHAQAVEVAKRYYAVHIAKRTEMVLACAHHPMDVDLYQSQKAIHNATFAGRSGGTIVLISPCRNGIGPRTFYELMSSHATPQALSQYVSMHRQLGSHKAADFAKAMKEFRILVVSGLSAETLRAIHLEACSPEALEREMLNTLSNGDDIAVMPEGSVTVPVTTRSRRSGSRDCPK